MGNGRPLVAAGSSLVREHLEEGDEGALVGGVSEHVIQRLRLLESGEARFLKQPVGRDAGLGFGGHRLRELGRSESFELL